MRYSAGNLASRSCTVETLPNGAVCQLMWSGAAVHILCTHPENPRPTTTTFLRSAMGCEGVGGIERLLRGCRVAREARASDIDDTKRCALLQWLVRGCGRDGIRGAEVRPEGFAAEAASLDGPRQSHRRRAAEQRHHSAICQRRLGRGYELTQRKRGSAQLSTQPSRLLSSSFHTHTPRPISLTCPLPLPSESTQRELPLSSRKSRSVGASHVAGIVTELSCSTGRCGKVFNTRVATLQLSSVPC